MFPTTVFGTNTLTAFYYYMVDKQSRMKSNNPEMPIDYENDFKYFRSTFTLFTITR